MPNSFGDSSQLDLRQLDGFTLRKFAAAVLENGIHEAAVLAEWALSLEESRHLHDLSTYTAAIQFTEKMKDIHGWMRVKTGTELLEWLGVDAESYWRAVDVKVSQARKSLQTASAIIARGPPK